MSCLLMTEEIKEIAKSFPQETAESIKNLISLWQESGKGSIESYPTVGELSDFMIKLRESKDNSYDYSTPTITTNSDDLRQVAMDYDPIKRRDRANLIAKLFSNEIDTSLQEVSEYVNKKLGDPEVENKEELISKLNDLDRISVLNLYTPAGIFNRVLDTFKKYVNDSMENNIAAELDTINSKKGSEKYSDEKKLEAAKKIAAYKNSEYEKLIRNFRALAEEAGAILSITEGIVVDSDDMASSDVDMTESDTDAVKVNADELSKEESVKDGWMTNFREISSHESLSKKVREVISNIPKLNSRGKIEKDDLGFPRYLDADYVHAALIDSLKDMIDSSDMIPTLNKLSTNKVWVKQLIKTIQGDNTLFSKFYQDFRKDFMPYWIQIKKLNPDGTYNIQTKPVNKPEGIYYLINSWRDNYEGNIMLDKDSVYTSQGFNTSNADKGLAILSGINSKFNNLSNKDKAELAGKDESIFNDLLKALHMVGVDANPDLLKQVIGTYIGTDKVDFTPSVVTLVNSLNVIFSDIAKNKVSTSDNNKNDLINLFSNSYSNIANILAEVTEDAIESSSRENGKSYYSHVTPSYLGKLIKNLKNVYNNKERFEQFINTEFKQYNWFFKNNSWRNDWLNQLVNSPKMREGLNRKVLLNSDKVEYTKWDDLDYSLILFNEYNSEPTNSKSDTKWAWYHVPILSDSPSAEFIRFRKYTNGDMYNEDGEPMSYQDILTNKFIDLVGQEYDRIMLVRARDNAYQNGDESIKPITNFDIVRNDKGEIINIGGAEFKFLPQLNSVELQGESFLDTIARLREDGDGATMKSYISAVIQDIMESSFEDAYKEWYDNGVFEETEDGKFKNLTFRDSIIKNNSNQAKLLREIKQLVTSESSESWSDDMESLLQQYVNNSPINDNFASSVLDDIYELESPDEKSAEKLENLKSRLSLKNTAKEAFREYFWNSSFATSQIIQLTTTDLAYYKDEVDFQKRYKEVYAPSLRLNTDATFNGEKVGRKIERTIYLKDEEIPSSALDDINEILKEHNVPDREEIIKKFKEVNVADAQAYRSLDSYRAIKVMSGDWNDDMEKAYHNFKNNTWDASDFDTIWQTIKPFVFTQVSNNSGIDTFGNIKTPVQHKNSEFLLLAMYNLVSGPLGKSGKLRAINSFMEQNNIDVVQFESAVKVGKQRRININSTIDNSVKKKLDNDLKEGTITQEEYNKQIDSYNVDSFDKTLEILNNATGIAAGNEDPNVVHAISYEDYGIQTATPEHAIDAKQLLGTQIKKLITADIPEDAIISVNGKNFSKAEFLSLYNSIITENMLESYDSVKEELLDPKEISNILIETVKSNKKYNYDMIKACTLDNNGDFTIPLFDPVQSVKTQQMLNSIIKSRIVKQKLKGGALIQVSDYGLSKDLHIVFTGKGKNKRIKYLECYMPAYSREFYEPLMDPETHQLDVSKLPDDLRKLIGYRV